MSVLALHGLRKAFGALVVTSGVDLALHEGECHALIGPNGAGKTTLIHQVSGTLSPDAGRIEIAGRDVTRLGAAARARAGLGRTFQLTSLVPGFTVRENAALAAQARAGSSYRFLGRASAERTLNETADAALAQVGLAHRADALASALSHGESRALALAVALAGRPRLLLLDEPMAGMGQAEGAALVEVLARLKRSVPILLVEHDMDAVFALADRVSVLVEGRIVATGAPEAVRADPTARAAYLGEAA